MATLPGNPFFIDASGMQEQSRQSLAGLGDVIAKTREKQAAQAQQQEAQQATLEAVRSKDPNKMAEISIKYPEMQQSMEKAFGITNPDTKAISQDAYRRAMADPENARQYLDQAAKDVYAKGGMPSNIVRDIKMLEQNPEAAMQAIKMSYAGIDPQGYKAFEAEQKDVDFKVGAQEILEDGTMIQSTDKGPVVYNPLGERVTGQAAADAVKTAQAEKVSNLRKAAGAKKTASLEAEIDLKGQVEAGVITQKEAAKSSVEAYKKLEGVNKNIANIDEAITLLDEGASTGAIQKFLPSVRAASVKLDNLQGRLGIDVIGSVTFGALSKGELDLALSTAMPKGLKPDDLKDWLTTKRDAQEKLADYLESAAIFLGVPGNTHSKWLQYQKEKGSTPGISGPQETQSIDDLVSKYAQ